MTDFFPRPAVDVGHVEPAPRRVRGIVAGRTVFDTTRAHYVWGHPWYPHYFVPRADCDSDLLVDEGRERPSPLGLARSLAVRDGDGLRPGAALAYAADAGVGIAEAVHFDWAAIDEWYEEDEQIFVHPRSPYVRVDAIRSSRHVRVEVAGVVLAESSSPVLLFETGLPTRYYFDRPHVRFEHLDLVPGGSSCPYKGNTSAYWSATVADETFTRIAWSYDFPQAQVQAIAGLVAFYDEEVDVYVAGRRQTRPARRAPGQQSPADPD